MNKHKISTAGFFKKESERFINRELSWIEFNRRVLEEALNNTNPLLERVKFLSISASNLDEFYMVRVAGLKEQIKHEIQIISQDGLTPQEQLDRIATNSYKLIMEQQKCWLSLKNELKKSGIIITHKNDLGDNDINWLKNYFLSNVFAALSPIAIDPAHPFPFLPNLGLAVILQIKNPNGEFSYIVMPLPSKINRFVRLDGKQDRVILLEDIIEICKSIIFPDKDITGMGLLQVIRDSDLEIEDEAEDLVSNFESAVKRRRRGNVISLKLKAPGNEKLKKFVGNGFKIDDSGMIEIPEIIGLDSIIELCSCDYPKLKFKPYTERFPERINDFSGDCFAAIASKDIIIHHPYETFDVVIRFLQQAARDPDVVAIKQTLYRTSSDSPIVKALVEAAEAGKSVTVVVELKARFDEESNIKWARNLERAGAQVVFGFVELKTHAKVSLVIRRENGQLKSYVHFGTGNYHPITARTYSDLSFFTCNTMLCTDAAYLFNYLTGYSTPTDFSALSVSPISLKKKILELIDNEINYAKAGKPANIWAKMNSLVDMDVIDALYAASQAGVNIDLVVRGICALRPGIPGFSENIRVKSIVGRFLEHARIICFGDGNELPSPKAKVFVSSSDWMQRNFAGRVEVLVSIENPTVHEQVMGQIMLANLKDQKQTWQMNADGLYTRVAHTKASFSAHEYFMTNPSLSGRGKALTKAESERQRRKIYKLLRFDKKRRRRKNAKK